MSDETLRFVMQTFITVSLALLGAIWGLLMLYRKIQAQHDSSLRLQRSNLRDSLKIDLFNQIRPRIDDTGKAVVQAQSKGTEVILGLRLRRASPGFRPALPDATELSRFHFEAVESLNLMTQMIGSYEIVLHDMGEMRDALITEAMQFSTDFQPFYSAVLPFLPIPSVDSMPAPDDGRIEELEALLTTYSDRCWNIVGYVNDFRVEAQNALLGDLFERSVPRRQPPDPSVRVLSRDEEGPRER